MSRTSSYRLQRNRKLVAESRALCNAYPAFCFRFLTKNKRHNLDCLSPENALGLVNRLAELGSVTWQALFGPIGKTWGLELLPYSQLHFTIPDDRILFKSPSGDSEVLDLRGRKVAVFRFANQKCRIIGVKRDHCSVLYVIGFDFDYDAYDHGG